MARVLLIDDSELLLQMLEMVCQQAGYDCVLASSFDDARASYEEEAPDAVITDLNLPGASDPIAALQALGDRPVIVVSGRSQGELDELVAERGVFGAISKDAGLPGLSADLPRLLAAALS